MAALSAAEREVWRVWNLLSDDDPAPVKHIARTLGMEPAAVAFIVYPAERFGPWADDQDLVRVVLHHERDNFFEALTGGLHRHPQH